MNLKKLSDIQITLDERIKQQHPIKEGEDRFSKKLLALLVELGECANEQRSWKFWSNNQNPCLNRTQHDFYSGDVIREYNPLLEEYIDNLHFILSLGREININIPSEYKREWMIKEKDIVNQFLAVFSLASRFGITKSETDFNLTLDTFMGLGEMLGFTWEEIEASYYEKNEINHGRQNDNY